MVTLIALHASDVALATGAAVGIGIGIMLISALIDRCSLIWDLREFAQFECPECGRSVGAGAARAGRDVSPFEEIWGDDEEGAGRELWHCHPTCREVRCEGCGHVFVLRLNRQGETCGPRRSVERWEDDDGGSSAA
jgi:hypothetical protein